MLQLTNGNIIEMPNLVNYADSSGGGTSYVPSSETQVSNNCVGGWPYSDYYTIWQSYPVYICSDKTAKAIEILKVLQAEKKIRCDSVPKFIELVEKISAIL